MNLFILNTTTYEVDISPEALQLKPFYKILARDRSINKKKAKAELAYIYFMCDYKSDYQSIADADERSEEIISVLEGLPDKYKPDKLVKDALEFYKERSKSIASVALEKQRLNINNLLENVGSIMESTDSNDLSRAATISEKIPRLILSIDQLEKIVKGQEESGTSRHRGSQEKSDFEDEML